MSVTSKVRTRARLAVTGLFIAAILVMPGAARASVEWTVCASGCNFTSITDAVTQSNPDDLIEVMPGTYPEKVVITQRLHILAPADGPRPVITWAGGGETDLRRHRPDRRRCGRTRGIPLRDAIDGRPADS